MPFDAGPRCEPPRFREEPIDWADVALRTVVIVPFLALYTLWLFGVAAEILGGVFRR